MAQIGDGDHGINMNKGFRMTREELDQNPGDLASFGKGAFKNINDENRWIHGPAVWQNVPRIFKRAGRH